MKAIYSFRDFAVKSKLFIVLIGIALVLALGVLSGCSGSQSSSSSDMRSVTDMRGRTVEIPAQVDRVVGIGCALRPICYLQAADKVVGVENDENEEDSVRWPYVHANFAHFSSLPIVGSGGSNGVEVNEEALMEAAPQVIICDSLQADQADALQEKTNIPVVCLDQPETVFDQNYYDNLEFLGEVLNKQDRATEVINFIQDTENDLQAKAQQSEKAGDVSAYAAAINYRGSHGFDGTEANFAPFSVNKITNIADGHGSDGPFTIDLEAISKAQPDYIFVEIGNLSMVEDDIKNSPSYFKALKAIEQGNVYSLISYRYYSTNVELALANCYQVGISVYPDQFEGVDPNEKLDEISEFLLGTSLSEDLAKEGLVFKKLDLMS